ncbi:tetratricopeptide repeat-containing sensor histidine kinase [Chryseobacterium sp. SN22]|uniref:tetratricopeptide repeat-containing sensor histidine kinase n=1 Tax=Chryseobacterium sp. SN22 TaxID=2606431 RepID=UPI0021CE510F|nr:tetratricopeptide repeat-containing sensor histidine kinase [Chryseobacterium sp. SN22]
MFTTSYNNIANASNSLKSYDSAIVYYKKAIKTADNSEAKFTCYNNIGDVLITQGKVKSALIYLKMAINADSLKNYSRAINNYAKAKYLDDENYIPLREFNKALEIRKKINDEEGLNSSFETLSTYYLYKDEKLSLEYAQKMLEEAKNNKSPDDQITALKRIISLDPKNYQQNFIKLDSIDNEVQTSRNKHKSQFAIVRYDVEQKNAENQRLEDRNFRQAIGIGSLIIALIIGIFWYKKRKKRLQQEKELEVKNTQLKMSKRVHDVVANGIYQVMAKIENQEDFDRNRALDELEYVYEKSRDLSYEKAGEEKEFSQEISELIAGFNNATVKTFTAGNDPSIWEKVAPAVKEEVYQMIRELMVNMKKHSQATHVAVKFEKTDGTVEIQYKDNGVGISGDLIYKNGLRNTASRIEAIGGTITFDTKIEKGLKVNLSFPAS